MATPDAPQPHSVADRNSIAEQARLDEALRRADHLLVSSLQHDDRRRTRRNLIIAAAVFVVALITVATTISFLVVRTQVDRVRESAVAADAEKSAPQLAADGWKLWQEQSLESAIKNFDEAVKLDPNNVKAWNGLGWANLNSGKSGPAEQAFHKVIDLEPKHPAALNGLGQIALAERKYDQAEKYLLAAAPQAPAAWFGLAKLYLLTGKYDQAETWAQKRVATGEVNPLAEQILKAAKAKEVPAGLREELEPSPTSVDLRRAWTLLAQSRNEESEGVFKELLAKDPKDVNSLNGMGWALLNAGDVDAAKPYFEQVLAVNRNAAGSMNGLARVLYEQGDVEGAIKLWKEMVEKFPGVHAGTSSLAEAYLDKGEYKKALPLLEQWAASDPHNTEVQDKLKLARDKTNPGEKKSGS